MDIGIDLMGSDCSPLELFQAILSLCQEGYHSPSFTLYVDELAHRLITTHTPPDSIPSNVRFQIVNDVIEMTDDPLTVLRKENCPQVIAIKALSQNKLDAFVSAGNTGALYVCAKKHLPLQPQISRPFLMVAIPVRDNHMVICDVGANMSCKAEHLLQFAHTASRFFVENYGERPARLALLNVGIEPLKGTQEHKAAYQKLAELSTVESNDKPFEFIGNIEGRDVFKGIADVVVTDGFSGNVLLKTMEGTADFIFERLSNLVEAPDIAKAIDALRPRFHYRDFSGAILAGVEGLVIKCHGDASEASMYNAILKAIQLLSRRT